MAEKEATVYIVDVGKSMGERRHGREITDLEWAMQYVWDSITSTVCILELFRVVELTDLGGYRAQDGHAGGNWAQNYQ
jgi:ATP-dependent DNA helicase 2 subunit 2